MKRNYNDIFQVVFIVVTVISWGLGVLTAVVAKAGGNVNLILGPSWILFALLILADCILTAKPRFCVARALPIYPFEALGYLSAFTLLYDAAGWRPNLDPPMITSILALLVGIGSFVVSFIAYKVKTRKRHKDLAIS